MPDEQTVPADRSAETEATDSGGARLVRATARTRQTATTLQGEQRVAELNFNAEHLSSVIALQSQSLENDDRKSERESGERKETRRLNFVMTLVLVITTIAAVAGISVFLVIYGESGLLGYILSGIGGMIAGAFGGYGYANRPR